MALLSDYVSGTLTVTNGSADVVGVGTGWRSMGFREGDTLFDIPGATEFEAVLADVPATETTLTLTTPWEGPTLTGVTYRLRFQSDGSRVGAQSRTLVEQLGNGNIEAFAGLTGPGIPSFNGPHSMEMLTRQDLTSGADYDVQVDDIAARAAYDGQDTGFSVLVADVGDGRAAIYSKNSGTSADWSDPAYVTGPVGPTVTIEAGTTTTLAPGLDATVDVVPVTGGYELDFGIPAGEGFLSRGAYSGATAYDKGDVVLNNSSSWIAKIATTGNAPPTLPTTSNTQWQLLAAKGTDGTGTGDVVGPVVSVTNEFAAFDGTTGKLLKAATYTPANKAGDQFTGDVGFGVAPVSNKGAIQSRKAVTAGTPVITGTTDPSQFASLGASTTSEIDFGLRATTNNVYLQARDPANFANRRHIELNPAGGQVLFPTKIAFSGVVTASFTSGNYFTNYTVGHNVGSSFNATTGYFTAPNPGLYNFSFGGINQAAAVVLRLRLAINAGERNPSLFTSISTGQVLGSVQFVMQAGDYIGVYVNSGTTLADPTPWGYGFFSGYLVG